MDNGVKIIKTPNNAQFLLNKNRIIEESIYQIRKELDLRIRIAFSFIASNNFKKEKRNKTPIIMPVTNANGLGEKELKFIICKQFMYSSSLVFN